MPDGSVFENSGQAEALKKNELNIPGESAIEGKKRGCFLMLWLIMLFQ